MLKDIIANRIKCEANDGGDGGAPIPPLPPKEGNDDDEVIKAKEEYEKLKKTLDASLSELAKIKREKKAIEDAGKTNEEREAERLSEYEAKLNEMTAKLCNGTATSITAEAKTKISLDKNDKSFDEVVTYIIGKDEEDTSVRATSLNKLLIAVYDKAVADTKKQGHMGGIDNLNTGGHEHNDPKETTATRIAKLNKSNGKSSGDIKKLYE